MKQILAPSILSADFKKLGEQIELCEQRGAGYLHFDVMDGMFVHNISFGIPVLECIKGHTKMALDVHLMIEEPMRYAEAFAKAGADILTVHYEACKDVQATVDKIHACGIKAGITIKPGTPVEVLKPFFGQVEMFLIMSVEPGQGGQGFIPESLDKVRALRKMLDEQGLTTDIEVDGGIKTDNVAEVAKAGANVMVAGSAVFKGDIGANVSEFMRILKEYE